MIIQDTSLTQYIRIKLQPNELGFVKYLINCKKDKKNLGWYTVENCLINDIVLKRLNDNCFDKELLFKEGLKDYQVKDVIKMCTLNNVCNFNKMGYGKTVETARAMRELQIKNAVIVAPKSVLCQWQHILSIWYPEIKDRIKIFNSNTIVTDNDVILVNYEKLIDNINLQKFKSFQWQLVVADEAHRIKNKKSKRTEAVKSIPAKRKFALTGTPMTKGIDDLWSILNFLGEYYSSKSYWNFVFYFCNVVNGPFGKKIEGITKDETKQHILQILLDQVAIRNPELNLTPGKVIETVKLEMADKQKKLYNDTKNLVLKELPKNMTIPNGAVLALRLIQVTSNPSQFECKDVGAKFEYIWDTLADNPDEKFVIFSKFSTTCEALKKFLDSKKIKTVCYLGSMDSVERFDSLMSFKQDKQCQAIIGTLGAMGEGVDGLQDVTNVVIFMEREWTPEITRQAEDRVNRLGQKHKVIVQYLECAKTFDQYVTKVNLTRADDIRRVLLAESEE